MRNPRDQWHDAVAAALSVGGSCAHGDGDDNDKDNDAKETTKDDDNDDAGAPPDAAGSGGKAKEPKETVTKEQAVAYLDDFLQRGEALMPTEYTAMMRRFAILEAQRARSGRVMEIHRAIPDFRSAGLRAWQACPVPRRALSAYSQFAVFPPPMRLEFTSTRPTEACVDLDSAVRAASAADTEWRDAVAAVEAAAAAQAAEAASAKLAKAAAAVAEKDNKDKDPDRKPPVDGDAAMAVAVAASGDDTSGAILVKDDATDGQTSDKEGGGAAKDPKVAAIKGKVVQLKAVDDRAAKATAAAAAVGFSENGIILRSAPPSKYVSGALAVDHSVAGENGTFKHVLYHDVDRLLLTAAAVRPDPDDLAKILRVIPEATFTYALKVAAPNELWKRVQRMSEDVMRSGKASDADAAASKRGPKAAAVAAAAARSKSGKGARGAADSGDGDGKVVLRPGPSFTAAPGAAEVVWRSDGDAMAAAEDARKAASAKDQKGGKGSKGGKAPPGSAGKRRLLVDDDDADSSDSDADDGVRPPPAKRARPASGAAAKQGGASGGPAKPRPKPAPKVRGSVSTASLEGTSAAPTGAIAALFGGPRKVAGTASGSSGGPAPAGATTLKPRDDAAPPAGVRRAAAQDGKDSKGKPKEPKETKPRAPRQPKVAKAKADGDAPSKVPPKVGPATLKPAVAAAPGSAPAVKPKPAPKRLAVLRPRAPVAASGSTPSAGGAGVALTHPVALAGAVRRVPSMGGQVPPATPAAGGAPSGAAVHSSLATMAAASIVAHSAPAAPGGHAASVQPSVPRPAATPVAPPAVPNVTTTVSVDSHGTEVINLD